MFESLSLYCRVFGHKPKKQLTNEMLTVATLHIAAHRNFTLTCSLTDNKITNAYPVR